MKKYMTRGVQECIPFDLVKLDNHSLETKNLTIKKWIKINSKENCCYKLLEE